MTLQRSSTSTWFGLAALLFLSATTRAQATGLVTINQIPDYYTAGQEVRDCLWLPGHHDVAYTMGCPTDSVYNLCYCPTGTAGMSTASSAITGCLTTWYSQTGALEVATAVSVYNEYCTKALALATTTGTTATTSSPTQNAGSGGGGGGGGLAANTIGGIIAASIVGVVLILLIILYFTNNTFKNFVNNYFKTPPPVPDPASDNQKTTNTPQV